MLERFRYVIFGIIALAIVGGIAMLLTYRPAPVVIQVIPPGPVQPTFTPLPTRTPLPTSTHLPTNTPPPTATPPPIQVYVTGAVQKPMQIYTLPWGSRVKDAIAAAGGTLDTANLSAVNQAQILHDGDQVYVPQRGEPTTLAPTAVLTHTVISATPAPATSTKQPTQTTGTPGFPVHVNTATLEELELLPGVGPKLAQEILDYRAQNGPFKSMDDLDKVKGIGPATLQKWEGLVAFD